MSHLTLDILRFSREKMLAAFDGLTLEQINFIPPGFKNNLAWQLGHVIAVEQAYLYRKAGLNINVDESLLITYGNGTVPTKDLTQAEIDALKKLALSSLDKIAADQKAGVFDAYIPFTITPKQLPINTIDDALQFIVFHDALHVGAAFDLKRFVTPSQSLAA